MTVSVYPGVEKLCFRKDPGTCARSLSMKVFVFTERIDNFVHACSMVSCEKRLFSLFFTIFENFRKQFSLSSDNAVRPKRFRHTFVIFESIFALKDVYISLEPWSITARKTLSRDFQDISLLFTRFSSSKSKFFLAFRF